MPKWMITGANGNLGKRLIKKLLSSDEVVAVVRSDKAADTVRKVPGNETENARLSVQVLAYEDVDALRSAATGCDRVVHLVGILKETAAATYEAAHEQSCTALSQALEGSSVGHISYLSIVGSRTDANNACLASKGRAEQILGAQSIPVSILRVPMVLGEGDYASFALRARALKNLSFTFRASSIEQPVYAGDVVEAVTAAGRSQQGAVLDLGGPEALSRRALTHRAAATLGRSTKVVSLPISLGYLMAWLFEKTLPNPPMTRAMLGVLDHDDAVTSQAAWQRLGTPPMATLDDMLKAVLSR